MRLILSLLLALALTACAATPGDLPSVTDPDTDTLVITPQNSEERLVELCWVGLGVVELVTTVTLRLDSSHASEVAGNISVVAMLLEDVAKEEDDLWPETRMAFTLLVLASHISDTIEDNVRGILLKGLSLTSYLNLAKRVGIDAFMARALVKDMKAQVSDLRAGDQTADQLFTACIDRINTDEGRVQALLGAS